MASSLSSGISRFATVAIWMAIAAACGARTTIDFGDDGNSGGGNGQGGSSSNGGTSTVPSGGATTTGTTTGGFSSTGGAPIGGTAGSSIGQAGSTGSAGSSSCRNVDCPDIACGPGFHTAMTPGACCPGCESCGVVACPSIKCGSGSHTELLPGQCCGTCVTDQKSCAEGEKDYLQFRSMLYDKYNSQSCSKDSDCTIARENNLCVNGCGVALARSSVGNWTSNLMSFAQSSCTACPPMIVPPCPPQAVRCTNQRCSVLAFSLP